MPQDPGWFQDSSPHRPGSLQMLHTKVWGQFSATSMTHQGTESLCSSVPGLNTEVSLCVSEASSLKPLPLGGFLFLSGLCPGRSSKPLSLYSPKLSEDLQPPCTPYSETTPSLLLTSPLPPYTQLDWRNLLYLFTVFSPDVLGISQSSPFP